MRTGSDEMARAVLEMLGESRDEAAFARAVLDWARRWEGSPLVGIVALRDPLFVDLHLRDELPRELGAEAFRSLEETVRELPSREGSFADDRLRIEAGGRSWICEWIRESGDGDRRGPIVGGLLLVAPIDEGGAGEVLRLLVGLGLGRHLLRRNLELTRSCLDLLNALHARGAPGREEGYNPELLFARLREIFRYDVSALALRRKEGWRLTLRVAAEGVPGLVRASRDATLDVLRRDHGLGEAMPEIEYLHEEGAALSAPADETIGSYIFLPLAMEDGMNGEGLLAFFSARSNFFTAEQVRLLGILSPGLSGAIRERLEMAKLRQRNVELDRGRRHMEAQIELATTIQEHLLPRKPPPCDGVQIGQFHRQVRRIGGDLFAYHRRGRRLGVAMADVSGKGVGAALLMAFVMGAMRSFLASVEEPRQLLEALNAALIGNTDDYRFVTFAYADLDLDTGILDFATAGHEPILLVRNGRITELRTEGIPLGIQEDFPYAGSCVRLEPEDLLFFFTDGAYDARNPDGERFGLANLRAHLLEGSAMDPERLVESYVDRVNAFALSDELDDDLTLVAARYLGSEAKT